ncbi:MAG: DUF2975 domain-containing protein [Arachnia sp.]
MKTRLLTFDRGDYLATKILTIAVAVGLPILLLCLPVYDALTGQPLRVTLPVSEAAPISAADGVTVTPWGVVAVEVAGASAGAWVLSLVPALVASIAVWVGAALLWRVVSAAATGAPFTVDTVHCLRGIALTVILGAAAHWFASGLTHAALSRQLLPGEETTLFVSTTGVAPLVVLGVGLLFAMVAEVVARGVVLEDELEGVI